VYKRQTGSRGKLKPYKRYAKISNNNQADEKY